MSVVSSVASHADEQMSVVLAMEFVDSLVWLELNECHVQILNVVAEDLREQESAKMLDVDERLEWTVMAIA